MDRVSQALKDYVKLWNQTCTDPRLQFIESGGGLDVSTVSGSVLRLGFSGGGMEGGVELKRLYGVEFKSRVAYKFLTDLASLSWNWYPPEIRTRVLDPAVEKFKQLFPRVGYAPAHTGYRIKWLPRAREIAECNVYIHGREQENRLFDVYRQGGPDNSPVIVAQCSTRATAVPRLPSRTEELDLSKVLDEEAPESGPSCVVCMHNKPRVAAICGHLSTCGDCARRIAETACPRCPTCRGEWMGLTRIYM